VASELLSFTRSGMGEVCLGPLKNCHNFWGDFFYSVDKCGFLGCLGLSDGSGGFVSGCFVVFEVFSSSKVFVSVPCILACVYGLLHWG
jgi:hypothetical protein